MNLRDSIPEGQTRVMLFQNGKDGSVIIAMPTHMNLETRRETIRTLNTGTPIGPTFYASQSLFLGTRLILAAFEAWTMRLVFPLKRAYNWFCRTIAVR